MGKAQQMCADKVRKAKERGSRLMPNPFPSPMPKPGFKKTPSRRSVGRGCCHNTWWDVEFGTRLKSSSTSESMDDADAAESGRWCSAEGAAEMRATERRRAAVLDILSHPGFAESSFAAGDAALAADVVARLGKSIAKFADMERLHPIACVFPLRPAGGSRSESNLDTPPDNLSPSLEDRDPGVRVRVRQVFEEVLHGTRRIKHHKNPTGTGRRCRRWTPTARKRDAALRVGTAETGAGAGRVPSDLSGERRQNGQSED